MEHEQMQSQHHQDAVAVSRRRIMGVASVAVAAGAMTATSVMAAPEAGRRFDGRVAIISGGARGQGRSHAVRLAREGASVVLFDLLEQIASIDYPLATQADMDETLELVRREGARCLGLKADVRDPKAVQDVVARTARDFGRCDILLSNAGVISVAPLSLQGEQTIADVVQTNLMGGFNCIRAVLPQMSQQQYGRIVVTSSQAGRQGVASLGPYVASKWGLVGLVKTVALEVAKQNITVNAVCPTIVNTPMVNNITHWPRAGGEDLAAARTRFEQDAKARSPIPQGIAWLEPGDVTDAVLFLASEASRHITGACLDIQGGMSAQNVA